MELKTLVVAILPVLLLSSPSAGQGHRHAHGKVRTSDHGPIVYVEGEVIDLGKVNQHERVPSSFFIQNRGDEDLLIEGLSANCGCTVLELDESQKVIPPLGKQEVNVFFSTENRIGRQRKKVTIVTNDPDYPITNLALTATVLGSFRVEPSRMVALNAVQPGDRLPSLQMFPNAEDATLENLEVELQSGLLDYALQSTVNDDGVAGIELSFNVADEIELGPVDAVMIVRGDVNGETLALPVIVKGTVLGPIEVRPSRIESTHSTPRGRVFAPVTLRPTDGTEFDVLSIDTGPYLEGAQKPGKRPGDIDIVLKLAEDAPDGPLAVAVAVHTSKADMPIVKIPVYIDVRPRCRVWPAQIALLRTSPDDVRRVRLQSDLVSALEIIDASCDNPQVTVNVLDPVRDSTKVRFVEIRWTGDAESTKGTSAKLSSAKRSSEKRSSAKLTIRTNVPKAETIIVPIELRASK